MMAKEVAEAVGVTPQEEVARDEKEYFDFDGCPAAVPSPFTRRLFKNR